MIDRVDVELALEYLKEKKFVLAVNQLELVLEEDKKEKELKK